LALPSHIEPTPFRLFIIAGEPSGDMLATGFVNALKAKLHPRPVIVAGVGDRSVEGKSLFPMSDIAVMGFTAVLQRLPLILRRIRETAQAAVAFQPDLMLSIDSPDFALRVAKKVRHTAPHIPIVHWVCPSVWAWRPKRAVRMKPHVDLILALLPFEPEAMVRLGGPKTVFVGHALIERLADFRPSASEQAQRDEQEKPTILILPGSRGSEIRHLLPLFGEVVVRVAERYPHARFVLPAVPHLAMRIKEAVKTWSVKPEIVEGEQAKLATFREARVALAASGTVTLELALASIPTVAAYRVGFIEAMIARRMIKVPTVLLPNLILGEKLMPEFLQEEASVEKLSQGMLSLLDEGAERTLQIEGFQRLEHIMKSSGTHPDAQAVSEAIAFWEAIK
jgi:lipid-A-disaccharide synthase